MTSCELVAPAGNLEKCSFALRYGADAVYLGLEGFNLRAGATHFSLGDAAKAVEEAHRHDARAYIALNAFLFDNQMDDLRVLLPGILSLGADAFIISDPSLIDMIRAHAPGAKIHLSTQMNVTNSESVRFWHKQGVSRIILARELDIVSIAKIRRAVPECEIEVFVHGALCVAFSGRCLISEALAGRNANQGDCAQPCRWKYRAEPADGESGDLILTQDDAGTTVMSSRDLCLFDHLPELVDTGVDALKIEGRHKSVYYAALTVRSYRKGLDACLKGEWDQAALEPWKDELFKISHRDYTTGFAVRPGEPMQTYREESYIRGSRFLGVVTARGGAKNTVNVRDQMHVGQHIDIVDPERNTSATVQSIETRDGKPLDKANPNQETLMTFSIPAEPYSLLRCDLEQTP